MAVAGPAASMVLGSLLLVPLGMSSSLPAITMVLRYLGVINWTVAIFNLVPAFPLDGGRVLRAWLWWWGHDLLWATRIASGTAAGASYQQVIAGSFPAGLKVRDVMNTNPVSVPPEISVTDLVEDYVHAQHHRWFPVIDDGFLVGTVSTREAASIPRTMWATTGQRDHGPTEAGRTGFARHGADASVNANAARRREPPHGRTKRTNARAAVVPRYSARTDASS
jgi:CBS domain-containing protein